MNPKSIRKITLLAILVILLSITTSTAAFSSLFSSSKRTASEGSLESCGIDDDILTLQTITITPDPPERGRDATITAVGDLKEEIVEGAKIKVGV
jgi:hypothetical protein